MRNIIAMLLFSCLPFILKAQQQDTIPASAFEVIAPDTSFSLKPTMELDTLIALDSNQLKKKIFIPNPKKAALYSLILPGGGQIYNRDWWKLPLVYGALGGVIYAIDYNSEFYNRFREALILKRQGEPHEFEGLSIDNEQALRNQRDEFDKNRQLAYVGLVFVYALNAVEAFVDAHLRNFDINDELTRVRLKPQFETIPTLGQPVIGLGLTIPINSIKKEVTPVPFEGF